VKEAQLERCALHPRLISNDTVRHAGNEMLGPPSPSKNVMHSCAKRTDLRVKISSDRNLSNCWTMDLPQELMGVIVQYLSPDEIQMARLVCRDWRRIISSCVTSLKPHYFDGTNVYHEVFNSVTELDLRGCGHLLKDDHLACVLLKFTKVHRLDLSGCSNLTDECIQMLFREHSPLRKNLSWLSLQNVIKITDESIFALCGMIKSQKTCAPTRITWKKAFRGAVRLEHLDLSGCILLSDSSMGAIRNNLPHLKNLKLGGYSRTSSVGDAMLLRLVDNAETRQSHSPSLRIKHLDLSGCVAITSSGISSVLLHLKNLDHLNLWNCMSLRSSSLESLSNGLGSCLALRELSLRGCHGIDDSVFEHISQLQELEKLDLRSCERITGRTQALLSHGNCRLSRLRHLNLKSCFGLTDLKGISSLFNLESLNISDCWQLQIGELKHLGKLGNLIELDLSNCRNLCNESGTPIPSLENMKRLATLKLANCERIRGGALSSVAKLANLAFVDLSRCSQLPASDLKYLWRVKSLVRLKASHCSWSGSSALKYVGPVDSLEELNLSGCQNLVGTSFEPLKHLKNLKRLVLDGCSNTPLFDRGLTAIASSLASLTHLSMQNCHTIGDGGVASLGQLQNLQMVNFSDCYGIIGDGFKYWDQMHNLEVVVLQGCSSIQDKGVKWLIVNNRTIRELNLKQCRRITDKTLFCIANHLPKIRVLSLQASMGVTDAGVRCIAERARHITELTIQFCWQFGDESAIYLAKMPWLKHLDLLYSWKITDVSIDALAQSSSLVWLNIFGCHRVSNVARRRIAPKLSPMCKA
jgi:hypothetical protein